MAKGRDPAKGIDFYTARQELKGLPARPLDTDWLAVDDAGHVAFFAGNDHGPIPGVADVGRVTEALEALARAAAAVRGMGVVPGGYRRADEDVREPVFDAPIGALGEPSHEAPLDGYPFLVVGTHPALRDIGVEAHARETPARRGIALGFPRIRRSTYDELHGTGLCDGCRVLDDPSDPRPRAPEVLAAAGLYVYAHFDAYAGGPYRRVASPSVAADLVDLETIVQLVASRVRLPVSFEEASSLQPPTFVTCD